MTVYAAVIAVTKDLPDVAGDIKGGIDTSRVAPRRPQGANGASAALALNYAAAVATACLAPAGAFRRWLMAGGHVLAAGGSSRRGRNSTPTPARARRSASSGRPGRAIKEYYKQIWNVLCRREPPARRRHLTAATRPPATFTSSAAASAVAAAVPLRLSAPQHSADRCSAVFCCTITPTSDGWGSAAAAVLPTSPRRPASDFRGSSAALRRRGELVAGDCRRRPLGCRRVAREPRRRRARALDGAAWRQKIGVGVAMIVLRCSSKPSDWLVPVRRLASHAGCGASRGEGRATLASQLIERCKRQGIEPRVPGGPVTRAQARARA